ncbi:MAG: CehA/McbA family metallohydrolase [Nannocystaceae bacterium]|nr:CehA/McbA family metallohydrolase [bacterium]
MDGRWTFAGVVLSLLPGVAMAAETSIVLDGTLPDDESAYVLVPFEVPESTLEIEVRHAALDRSNVLDWGLLGPDGFRGWGGGNAEDVLVGADYASRSYRPGPIETGTWHVLIGKARIDQAPAAYALEVLLRDEVTGTPRTRAPYVAPVLQDAPGWYAGDVHVHSLESGDARPDLLEIGAFAAEVGLDFVVISDHNVHTALDFFNEVHDAGPGVLFVPGVEFTTYAGHANGLGATEWVDFRVGDTTAINDAVSAYHEQGALFVLNHPTLDLGPLCIGCTWQHALDPAEIDAVELTVAGSLSGGFVASAIEAWDALCDQGVHVTPVGGSDDHKAGVDLSQFQSPIGQGTTVVEADALSAAAIVAGIRRGRTVVMLDGPGDPMVVFDAPGREGDTVRGEAVDLVASITGAQGETARLVVNGEPSNSMSVDGDPFEMTWTVDAPAQGQDRYRVEVLVDGQLRTITSHLWVEFEAEPAAGSSSGGGGGSGEPGSTGSDRPTSSGGAVGTSSGADADPGSTGDEGCGCAHQRGAGPLWSLCVLLGILGRRRRR